MQSLLHTLNFLVSYFSKLCKDRLVHYYAGFGFVSEGVSGSTHGGVVWYQMRLTF